MAHILQIALTTIVAVLLLSMVVSGEVVSDSTKDRIVVHTPLQNYEQPSLRDYEECQTNRHSCMDTCNGQQNCESECPLCPVLTDEPLLVQGVNDTSYVRAAQPAVNTTNIIRLTNEINNVIKNDIQARHEVNVQVHQNVSQVGGRFGLGYSEHGSCCYVVRRDRDCEHKDKCKEHSRQRVCGERCQARVMIAKLVVVCVQERPEDCHETIEYVPARRHRSRPKAKQPSAPCSNVDTWPYVSCAGQYPDSRRIRRAGCQGCLQLTYGYILQNGLPAECGGCFQRQPAQMMVAPIFYPPYANPNFDYIYNYRPRQPDTQNSDDELKQINDSDGDNAWVLDTEKCLDANGKMGDCADGNAAAPDIKPSPPAHLEQGDEDDDNNSNIDDDYSDAGYDVPAQRRRHRRQSHHKFARSMYSRRTEQ